MKIIPSLVEQTAYSLFDRIIFLSPYYQQFQVDIQDGVFIRNKTLSIDDFIQHIKERDAFLSSGILYDFHIMSIDYQQIIEQIDHIKTRIQVQTILVHTKLNPEYFVLCKKYPQIQFGLVINPEEDVTHINSLYDLKSIPIIQLMTIHPGPQGQDFIPNALNKIEQLRNYGFHGKIYIDGAINETTIPLMMSLSQKPDVFCPGSYLAQSPKEDLKRRVDYLHEI